jgi:hypothetical protein
MMIDATEPETTARKQRGKPFEKGQSGNPAGRPRGARHKATLLAEKLMAEDVEDVVKAVVTAAKGGDIQAAKVILDRVAPARRDSPISFNMPKVGSAADAAQAMSAVLNAVADGAISPSEGQAVATLVEIQLRALEASDFEARLSALESKGTS